MNIIIPILIVAVALVLIGLKWNNLRTKMAYLLILLGIISAVFLTFMISNGENINFSEIQSYFVAAKVYFLWIKSALVNVFEITGKIIGLDFNLNILTF